MFLPPPLLQMGLQPDPQATHPGGKRQRRFWLVALSVVDVHGELQYCIEAQYMDQGPTVKACEGVPVGTKPHAAAGTGPVRAPAAPGCQLGGASSRPKQASAHKDEGQCAEVGRELCG
jgi:hypothetical protein